MNTPQGYAKKFREELIKISINKIWKKAKEEWVDTEEMFIIESPEYENDIKDCQKKYPDVDFTACECICEHYIQEHCVIKNKITNKKIAIGNTCIEKFDTEYHKDIAKRYKKISKALHNLKNKLLNEHTIYFVPDYLNTFLLKNKYITEEDSNILKEFVDNTKKYNKQIETFVSYDMFIKLIKILFKIIKEYYHKEIKNKEMNTAMFDIIMYLVNNQHYKEKYYDENVEKYPGNDNTKYKLIYVMNKIQDKGKWKWICVERKMICNECEKERMIKIKNIINNEKMIIISSSNDDDINYNCKNNFIIDDEKEYCVKCYMKNKMKQGKYKCVYGIKRNDDGIYQLYYQKTQHKVVCEICTIDFYNNIDSINICDICIEIGIPCGKCIKIKNYYRRDDLTPYNNGDIVIPLCKQCSKASEYIKDFDKMRNYGCSECENWNFLYYPCNKPELKKHCAKHRKQMKIDGIMREQEEKRRIEHKNLIRKYEEKRKIDDERLRKLKDDENRRQKQKIKEENDRWEKENDIFY